MMAWTSPLRTVRSMPRRISLSGLPDGHDVEVADDELAVVARDRSGARAVAAGGGVDGVHAVGIGSVLAGRSATGRAVALTGGW